MPRNSLIYVAFPPNGTRSWLRIPLKKSESHSDPATLVGDLGCFGSWTPASRGSAPSTQTGKNVGGFQRNPILRLDPNATDIRQHSLAPRLAQGLRQASFLRRTLVFVGRPLAAESGTSMITVVIPYLIRQLHLAATIRQENFVSRTCFTRCMKRNSSWSITATTGGRIGYTFSISTGNWARFLRAGPM